MSIRIKYPDPYGYEEQPKFDGLSTDLSKIKGKNDEQDKVNIKQDAEIANLDETNKKQDVEIENKKITVEQEGNLFIFYQGGEKIASIYQEEGSGSTVVGGELSDGGNTLTIIKDSGSNVNIDISQLINEVELNAVVNAINTNIVGVTNNLHQEITDTNTTLNAVKDTADEAKRIADTAYLNDKYTRELVDKNTADIAKIDEDIENLSTKITEEYAEKKSVEELISMLQSDIY